MINNMLKKIDWCEIAGECINNGQEVGYLKAMIMVDMYDKRATAESASFALQVWNKAARGLKQNDSHFNWAVDDDKSVQKAYREMVKANSRSNQL